MIFGCVNVYQDVENIERCLDSLRNAVDDVFIVAVDGAYQYFPHGDTPHSVDGTLEICRAKADYIIKCPHLEGWPDEETKRSQYFIGNWKDIYFVVDSDEEVIGKFPSDWRGEGRINLERDDDKSVGAYPIYRIHEHFAGIRYSGTHHAVWDLRGRLRNVDFENMPIIKGCSLLHHFSNHARERFRDKAKYHNEWLKPHEKEFRLKWNL